MKDGRSDLPAWLLLERITKVENEKLKSNRERVFNVRGSLKAIFSTIIDKNVALDVIYYSSVDRRTGGRSVGRTNGRTDGRTDGRTQA